MNSRINDISEVVAGMQAQNARLIAQNARLERIEDKVSKLSEGLIPATKDRITKTEVKELIKEEMERNDARYQRK